ncbi:hypothetical protein FRC06_010367 [Ceratobasidium sp. 370]|nr:hypothetical protein FRC06_010367 [Ceratobasidium sp. 370]
MLLFVFGATGAGKTTLINNLTGSDLEVGNSLESCTTDIQGSYTDYRGRRITVFDTPGFDDSRISDVQVLKKIATFLEASHDVGSGRASGIIFVHDINNPRVSGTSLKNLRMFKGLVGDDTLKNVVFVTNKWSSPPSAEQERRQMELEQTDKYFGAAIKQGARIFRGGRDVGHEDVVGLLDMFFHCRPSSFQIQREMADGKDLAHTTAGMEVHREQEEIKQKYLQEMAELRKVMEEAKHRDQELYNELLLEKQEAQRAAAAAQRQQDELKSHLEEERRALQGQLERYMNEQKSMAATLNKRSKLGVRLRAVGLAASLGLAMLGIPFAFGS